MHVGPPGVGGLQGHGQVVDVPGGLQGAVPQQARDPPPAAQARGGPGRDEAGEAATQVARADQRDDVGEHDHGDEQQRPGLGEEPDGQGEAGPDAGARAQVPRATSTAPRVTTAHAMVSRLSLLTAAPSAASCGIASGMSEAVRTTARWSVSARAARARTNGSGAIMSTFSRRRTHARGRTVSSRAARRSPRR